MRFGRVPLRSEVDLPKPGGRYPVGSAVYKESGEPVRIRQGPYYCVGSSAGGYLAIMLSLFDAEDRLGMCDELVDLNTHPAAVIAYCPVVFLDKSRETQKNFMAMEEEEAYGMASPLLRSKSNLPPYLILQGDADEITPIRYARLFHQQVLESGGTSIMKELPGVKHGFGYGTSSEPQKICIREIESFLNSKI